MKSPFYWALFLLLLAGGLAFRHQERQVRSLQAQLGERASSQVAAATLSPKLKGTTSTRVAAPPGAEGELIRLRGEVSLLQKDLNSPPGQTISPHEAEADWALVHSGPKASDDPGYISLTNCASLGFETPRTALQSYFFAMHNQEKQPLTPAHMKEIWDVPDDFDAPSARYSIDLGQGYGGEKGYRIVEETDLGSNSVRLTLEFQYSEGNLTRRDLVLVEHNGNWRLKPTGVTRSTPQ
jgi:hypothetical protein